MTVRFTDMAQSDLQSLRRSLARRLREKAELEQKVRAIQSEFEEEVAPLQEEVLRLQKERLKEAAQKRMRNARLRNAYHDARDAHESFRKRREQATHNSGQGDYNLKATYRRATKQCHPDTVADSYRNEAAATFRALESAFDAELPEAVEAIAEPLERWGFPRAPSAPPESSVADAETTLQRALADLENSVERLRASDVYDAIIAAGNAEQETALEARKRALWERVRELKRQRTSRL